MGTIRVSENTKVRLKSLSVGSSESYESIIVRLLDAKGGDLSKSFFVFDVDDDSLVLNCVVGDDCVFFVCDDGSLVSNPLLCFDVLSEGVLDFCNRLSVVDVCVFDGLGFDECVVFDGLCFVCV